MTRLVILILLSFGLGTLVGGKAVLDDPSRGLGKVVNETLGKPADVDYSLFWEVYAKVHERFPKDIDEQAILHGAIRGAVAGLDDPYSLFLTQGEAERFFQDLDGEFSGIGAEITQEEEQYLVVSPLPGSPAEQAGLKPRDVITSVDERSASELVFGELISAIRGPQGSTVKLGIRRGDEELVVEVTRDTIEVSSVTSQLRDDGIGVIRLTQFGEDTTRRLVEAAESLRSDNVRAIILDLRNNPGGFLDGAIEVTSLFTAKSPVLIEENKEGKQEAFNPTLDDQLADLPIVVLVNDGSASASEIVAGALQDHEAATIVGTVTFGKGSVQEVEKLRDGSALRLTIAAWLTPKGRAIDGEGITPDVEIEDDPETEPDEQLLKAVELLSQ